jgi:hypothetical protein
VKIQHLRVMLVVEMYHLFPVVGREVVEEVQVVQEGQ